MMRAGLLLAAAFLLMGNSINVVDAPRIVQPRGVEIGAPVTVSKGETFLVADIFESEYLTLEETYTFAHFGLVIELPAGTHLSRYYTYRKAETDPVYEVYCGRKLISILGGKDALPPGMDRRIAPTYRLCFFANADKTALDHVFIAGGSGNYAGIGQLEQVAVRQTTTPRKTGITLYWELNDVWGSANRPRAKMLVEIAEEDGRLAGQRIFWERDEANGITSALTAIGAKEASLPHDIENVFGIYDITILSADTKADTITYRVNAISPSARFVDRQGSVPGGYTVRTIYIP